jgi:hypothetical protein
MSIFVQNSVLAAETLRMTWNNRFFKLVSGIDKIKVALFHLNLTPHPGIPDLRDFGLGITVDVELRHERKVSCSNKVGQCGLLQDR